MSGEDISYNFSVAEIKALYALFSRNVVPVGLEPLYRFVMKRAPEYLTIAEAEQLVK